MRIEITDKHDFIEAVNDVLGELEFLDNLSDEIFTDYHTLSRVSTNTKRAMDYLEKLKANC